MSDVEIRRVREGVAEVWLNRPAVRNAFNDEVIAALTVAFRALDAVKTARPLVVSVEFPRAVEVTGWAYRGAQRRELDDSATRDAAVRRIVEANAATLHRAGVKFALAPGALGPNDFMANVRKAIASPSASRPPGSRKKYA